MGVEGRRGEGGGVWDMPNMCSIVATRGRLPIPYLQSGLNLERETSVGGRRERGWGRTRPST